MIKALLEVGFLEKEKNNKGYKIHGWNELEGHLVAYHKRAVKAAKARWNGKSLSKKEEELLKKIAEKDIMLKKKEAMLQAMQGHRTSNAPTNNTNITNNTLSEEGACVFKILKERPELSRLTVEQAEMARKDFVAAPGKIDWEKVGLEVSEKAVLAGNIDQPGSWLRVQFDKVIRGMYPEFFKKDGPVEPDPRDPRKRMFEGVNKNGADQP